MQFSIASARPAAPPASPRLAAAPAPRAAPVPVPEASAHFSGVSLSRRAILASVAAGSAAVAKPPGAKAEDDIKRPMFSMELVDDETSMRNYYKTQSEIPMSDSIKLLRATRNVMERYMMDLPSQAVGSDERKYVNRMSAGFAGLFRKAGLATQIVFLKYGGSQEDADAILVNIGSMISITGRALLVDLQKPGAKAVQWDLEAPARVIASIDALLANVPKDVYDEALASKSDMKIF